MANAALHLNSSANWYLFVMSGLVLCAINDQVRQM